MIPIRTMPVKTRTDRDAEVPVLLDFVGSKVLQFSTLLDIGSFYSYHTYLNSIRQFAPVYDGIDIKDDHISSHTLNNFYLGNANNMILPQYDFVICVSTIEHAGISTYKGNYIKEQFDLFKKCLELSKKFAFISFPVGQPKYYPDEWATIERKRLEIFEGLVAQYKVKQRFFYNKGVGEGNPWQEHSDRDLALSIPYQDKIGTQSICVLEIEK